MGAKGVKKFVYAFDRVREGRKIRLEQVCGQGHILGAEIVYSTGAYDLGFHDIIM